MNPEIVYSEIINTNDLEKWDNENDVISLESVELGDKTWVKYTKKDVDDNLGVNNISVPITTAITA
jgi:hypothetical protein